MILPLVRTMAIRRGRSPARLKCGASIHAGPITTIRRHSYSHVCVCVYWTSPSTHFTLYLCRPCQDRQREREPLIPAASSCCELNQYILYRFIVSNRNGCAILLGVYIVYVTNPHVCRPTPHFTPHQRSTILATDSIYIYMYV